MGTNERDFVLKVVSLEAAKSLLSQLKLNDMMTTKKTARPKASLRNSSEHYWENVVHFLR